MEQPQLFEDFRTVVFGYSQEGIRLPEKLKRAREKGIPQHFQSVPYCRCSQHQIQQQPIESLFPENGNLQELLQTDSLFNDLMFLDEKEENGKV